jgi:uroporphyrinogen decarboxylase
MKEVINTILAQTRNGGNLMNEMTSRERVLAALNHTEPDRVPLDLGGLATTIESVPYEELKTYLGLKGETKTFLRDHVEPPQELLDRFGIDTRYVRLKPPKNFKTHIEPDNSYLDEWGTRWKKPPSSLYWDPVEHPLKDADVEDLEGYPWPDPDDPGRVEGLRDEAKRLRAETDYAIIADMPVLGLFESGWVTLRGAEQYFMDMAINKPFIRALMEILTDLQIRFYKNYMDAVGDCIDIVVVADDLGSENGLLVSLDHYRELVKPYQRRLWQSIKENTDAHLFLHCCGSIHPLISDLIELGVDILNPVQVSAKNMDTQRLKSEFGDRITFWGGIDTQHVLPFGSPEDVKNEVKKRIADLAPGGGYVLTAVHNIQAAVKPENICAMYDAARSYGRYPIMI